MIDQPNGEWYAMPDDDTQARVLSLLDVLAVQVGATNQKFDALQAEFQGLNTKVERLDAKFDDFRTETQQGFLRVERSLGNIETRLERREIAHAALERRVATLESRHDPA